VGYHKVNLFIFGLEAGLFLLRLRRREYKAAEGSGPAYGIILNPGVGPGLFGHGVLREPVCPDVRAGCPGLTLASVCYYGEIVAILGVFSS